MLNLNLFNRKKYTNKYNTLRSIRRNIIGKFFFFLRVFFGGLTIVGGFVLGTWISVYYMLYQGIVSFINGIFFQPSAAGIATGIIKWIFAVPFGALVGGIVVMIGAFIMFGYEMLRDW
jgi:hypothetical protein